MVRLSECSGMPKGAIGLRPPSFPVFQLSQEKGSVGREIAKKKIFLQPNTDEVCLKLSPLQYGCCFSPEFETNSENQSDCTVFPREPLWFAFPFLPEMNGIQRTCFGGAEGLALVVAAFFISSRLGKWKETDPLSILPLVPGVTKTAFR